MGKVIPLTTHNAEIKTATVELKTLTVTGKQVTLAVFRQLLEEPLINDDGTFAGNPWGFVNYCPGKTCLGGKHWHVVWQKGTELRRSTVMKEELPHKTVEGVDINKFFGAHALEALTERREWAFKADLNRAINEGFLCLETNDRVSIYASLTNKLSRLRFALGSPSYCTAEQNAERAKERDELLAWFDAEGYTNTEIAGAWKHSIDDMVAAERDRIQRHIKRREEIEALPQLFIAV